MQAAFVQRILESLVRSGDLSNADSILSVCADPRDGRLFAGMGFENVTLSNLTNLDERAERTEEFDYPWHTQDAQSLTYEDGSFDVAFVSAGLHHCQWPHRAVAEMFRVARKAVIVVESRESLLVRLAVRLGITRQYEINRTLEMAFGGFVLGDVKQQYSSSRPTSCCRCRSLTEPSSHAWATCWCPGRSTWAPR